MDFGSRLREWLRVRGRTQKWLARKVGVTAGAVTAWVKGESDPTHRNLNAILAAFGLSWAEFFGPIPDTAAAA